MGNRISKYNPEESYNCENAGVNVKSENIREIIYTPCISVSAIMKEVEPRAIKADGELNGENFSFLAAMHKFHPGLDFFKIRTNTEHSPSLYYPTQIAIKLGKSYRSQEHQSKGNVNTKKNYTMKTFEVKRILVPTDFSETGMLAIEHAAYMAKLCKARLFFLHVVESFEYAYSEYEPEVLVKDLEGVQTVATERLERIASSIETQYGIETRTLLNTGKASTGIVESVKDNNIDMIVMGTHGAKGFEEFVIGSNAQKVASIAPCPVITLQATAKNTRLANIVVPIDNSLHSRQKVNYAIEIAAWYGAKIHLLGLLDSNEEVNEADENRFKIKLDAVENVLKQSEIPYVRKLIKGHNLAKEAMKYSEDVGADMLVIMADHESNVSANLLGTSAKQIINHSKIPVMSIKPIKGPVSGTSDWQFI